MSKYVPDISSKRWVIISPQRINRIYQKQEKSICPFCPGNEAMTTPEVMRVGKGEPGKPGWDIRVIPNKYPITAFHEVIIHTPDCHKDLEHLSESHLKKIFQVYRTRFNFYRQRGQVMIFCNHRENAGASLKHSHSQLVVLPFQINLDTLAREPMNNIIEQNKYFNLYCPDFSQWPFEVWLAPKKQNTYFGDITDEEISDLVVIFKRVLNVLIKIHKKYKFSTLPFAYNFYIYPKENWYFRLIPRFINRAGFELGTGLSVNIVDPKDAAEEIKNHLETNI